MEMVPKMKRQWKAMVNPSEREPHRGSLRLMSLQELPDICPTVEAWHKGKSIGEAYIDGGAQVCVITHASVEKFSMAIAGNSGFRIRMANHQRVKCLGMVQNLEIEVFGVKALVKFSCYACGTWCFSYHPGEALVKGRRCNSRLEKRGDYGLQQERR